METRFFDCILDPVLVVSSDGIIHSINPAGIRWLAVSPDTIVVGKSIDNFVIFSGANISNAMNSLQMYAYSPYEMAHFKLPARNYDGLAKVAVQKLPGNDSFDYFAAIIVRDATFAQTLWDNDTIYLEPVTLHEDTSPSVPVPEGYSMVTQVMSNVLDEMTINKAMPHERTAQYTSTVNLFVLDIKKASVGRAILITDDWIDVIVRPVDGIQEGMKCNLEVAGNPSLRGFSTSTQVTQEKLFAGEHQIRLQFTALSPLAKRNLTEFLDANALK